MFSTRCTIFHVYLLVFCVVNGNYHEDKYALKDEFDRTEKYQILNVNANFFLSDNIIEFEAFNQHYKVKLTANQHFAIDTNETKKKIDPKNKTFYTHFNKSCYYFGKVLNSEQSSSVAVSMCDGRGITGILSAFGETLMIKPYGETSDHVVIKLSESAAGQGTKDLDAVEPKKDKAETIKILFNNFDQRRRRRLVYNNGNNVVEIYILSDASMTEHFQDQFLTTWYDELIDRLSQIINGANAEYINQFWGDQIGQVSLKWVELELVEAYEGIYATLDPPLLPNGEIDSSAYLRVFRNWVLDNKNQNDFDAAILFTKDAMDSSGRAFKEGMCNSWPFSVITDRGNLAREIKLVAHEVGHNFGMEHDEPQYNNCPDGHIMGDGDYNTGWSSCSVQYMNSWFAQNNGLRCLVNRNKPFKTNYNGGTASNPNPIPGSSASHNAICQGGMVDCSCPSGTMGICEINCLGVDGCKDGIIFCNNNGYKCIVNCVGNGACGGSANIIGPDGGELFVNCIGEKSCEGSLVVQGETGTNVYVKCAGDTTCKSGQFFFGTGEGIIYCNGQHDTCQDAVFNGQFVCIGESCPV